MIKNCLFFLIYFWHYFVGRTLTQALGQPVVCRFYPSCAIYFKAAITKFGVVKGIKLAILRILKCRPGGKLGVDLVP